EGREGRQQDGEEVASSKWGRTPFFSFEKRVQLREIGSVPISWHSSDKEEAMLQKSPMYSYIPVKDVARARQFYEQKLGFKPKSEENGGVVYEFGEHTAGFLYPTPNAGTSRASQAFWQVDDVEREVAELKARGV